MKRVALVIAVLALGLGGSVAEAKKKVVPPPSVTPPGQVMEMSLEPIDQGGYLVVAPKENTRDYQIGRHKFQTNGAIILCEYHLWKPWAWRASSTVDYVSTKASMDACPEDADDGPITDTSMQISMWHYPNAVPIAWGQQNYQNSGVRPWHGVSPPQYEVSLTAVCHLTTGEWQNYYSGFFSEVWWVYPPPTPPNMVLYYPTNPPQPRYRYCSPCAFNWTKNAMILKSPYSPNMCVNG